MRVIGGLVIGLTLSAIIAPAYLGGEFPRPRSGQVLALLPSATLGFLVLAIFTAVASAGGREVVPRDQAVAFPVSTMTDHLGALVLAPLNIAWIMQAWMLLGMTSYALGPDAHVGLRDPLLLWIVAATALAQVVGWIAEGVRRGPHGIAVFRVLVLLAAAGATALVATGNLARVLDNSPTSKILVIVLDPQSGRWLSWVVGHAGDRGLRHRRRGGRCRPSTMGAGAADARGAAPGVRRYPARSAAASDLMMMLRIDRAAVWRSVPLRRG